MSMRKMTVQYIGDTLYLPSLEREVRHIIERDVEQVSERLHAFGWEKVVRCRDCKFIKIMPVRYSDRSSVICLADWWEGSEGDHPFVDPDGFCAWGELDDARDIQ